MRRLRGERFRSDEVSTFGMDTWAVQVDTHLRVAGKASEDSNEPWKEWKEQLHVAAVKDFNVQKFNLHICLRCFCYLRVLH